MIKLLGIIMVFSASSSIGIGLAKRLRNRADELRELKFACASIEGEITFNQIPLGDILTKTSINISGGWKEVFASTGRRIKGKEGLSFRKIFSEEIANNRLKIHLKQHEIEQICLFFDSLGRTDIENQRKKLRLAVEGITPLESAAAMECDRYYKLYTTLGICGGLVAVILMM